MLSDMCFVYSSTCIIDKNWCCLLLFVSEWLNLKIKNLYVSTGNWEWYSRSINLRGQYSPKPGLTFFRYDNLRYWRHQKFMFWWVAVVHFERNNHTFIAIVRNRRACVQLSVHRSIFVFLFGPPKTISFAFPRAPSLFQRFMILLFVSRKFVIS